MPYRTFALFAYTGGFLMDDYHGESWLFPGREMASCLNVLTPIHHSFGSIINYRLIIGIYWKTVKPKKQ
jgi:hypothetical protein